MAWLGGMAFDGWRLARGTHPDPLTTRSSVVPAAVGVVLVVAMVAGYLLYGAAGRRVYAAGLAAQSRADCASAIMKYDTVTGAYELTLSRDVPAARAATEQCAAFAAASDAQERGAYTDAARRYHAYRNAYPATVLVPYVHDNLKRTYTDWAGSLRAARDYPGAIQVYRDLLAESGTEPGTTQVRSDLAATYFEQAAELRATLPTTPGPLRVEQARSAVETLLAIQRAFGDTATAPKVPQAIVDTFTAANSLFTEQRFCDAVPVLDYFVTLPDAETAGVVGTANADRAQAMLECGLEAVPRRRLRRIDHAAGPPRRHVPREPSGRAGAVGDHRGEGGRRDGRTASAAGSARRQLTGRQRRDLLQPTTTARSMPGSSWPDPRRTSSSCPPAPGAQRVMSAQTTPAPHLPESRR